MTTHSSFIDSIREAEELRALLIREFDGEPIKPGLLSEVKRAPDALKVEVDEDQEDEQMGLLD